MFIEKMRMVLDLGARARTNNRPYATPFLSAEDRMILEPILLGQDYSFVRAGMGERFRLVLLPCADFPFDASDFVRAIEVVVNDHKVYEHRDYLGSLMALQIERDAVGDILIVQDRAFILFYAELESFILQNFTSVSRTGVNCKVVDLADLQQPQKTEEMRKVSVSSMRADCILSANFKLSRESASSLIEKGLLQVNGDVLLKPEKKLKYEDKFVLRGYGRWQVLEQVGQSKKGKLYIELKSF